jgi:hypothetical protein
MQEEPRLLQMEDDDDSGNMEEEGAGEEENQDLMQEDSTHNSSMGGANPDLSSKSDGQQGGHKGKSIMHNISAQIFFEEADMLQGEPLEDVEDVDAIDVQGLDELYIGHNSPQPADHGSETATPRAVAQWTELAAIPKAVTPMRRSKR